MTRLVLVLLLLTWPAVARPPPGADPDSPLSQWFRGLKNHMGGSCCDVADCRPTPVRVLDGQYQAWHEGKWLPVPEEAILPQMPNPVGEAVVCVFHGTVLCLVRGPEG